MANKKKSANSKPKSDASKGTNEPASAASSSFTSEPAPDSSSAEPPIPNGSTPSNGSAGTSESEAESLKEKGTTQYKAKDYAGAIDAYSQAIDKCSTYIPAVFNRAAAYMATKQFSKALQDCQTTASLQSSNPQPKTLARLAKCQIALGHTDQASQTLSIAKNMPGIESATLNSVLTDLSKLDRIANHLASIQKARKDESWSMVLFGLDALSKEVDTEPLPWKLLRVEATVSKGKYDEAAHLATYVNFLWDFGRRAQTCNLVTSSERIHPMRVYFSHAFVPC